MLLCVVESEKCSSKVIFRILLQSDTMLLLRSESDLTSQPETSNSPNLFTKSASPSLQDLLEGLLKIILVRGSAPEPPGGGLPVPLPTLMAIRPRRSIYVMTLRRATNRQDNN